MPPKTQSRGRPLRLRYLLLLELVGRTISERRVEPDLVVDLLDKFAHMIPQFGESRIAAGIHFFPLERLDEALAFAVLPGAGWPAHTQMRSADLESFHVFAAGILRAPIRMMDQTRLRMAARKGGFQSR